MREAFQTAELLSSEGYPKGIRAIVISNAGGFAVLSSDYAEIVRYRSGGFPQRDPCRTGYDPAGGLEPAATRLTW